MLEFGSYVTLVISTTGYSTYFCTMGLRGTKFYSIFWFKCPRCHEGDLYKKKNPYDFGELTKMEAKCSHCGESFSREPGFYFGAAYVSYALTVALWVAVLVALITFDSIGWIEFGFFSHPLTFIITGVVSLVVLLPVIYRLSRSIWINFFVQYDKLKAEKKNEV